MMLLFLILWCKTQKHHQEVWDNLNFAGRKFQLDTEHPILGIAPLRSTDGQVTAIPFHMIANRCKDTAYRVWTK